MWATYVDPASVNRTTPLNDFLTQLASLISTGQTTSGIVRDGGSFNSSTTTFPIPTQAGLNTAGSTGLGPKAYLNWLVFDKEYNFLASKSGYKRISATPKETGQDVAHELLNSPEIIIDEPGYVYIYLSNEESTPIDVYFDDFKVEHHKSRVFLKPRLAQGVPRSEALMYIFSSLTCCTKDGGRAHRSTAKIGRIVDFFYFIYSAITSRHKKLPWAHYSL